MVVSSEDTRIVEDRQHQRLLLIPQKRSFSELDMRRKGGFLRHQRRAAWLFLALPGLLFVIFTVIPFVVALCVSLTDYSIVESPVWVGLKNYVEIAHDPYFWTAIKNTIYYTVLFVPLGLLVSLGTALLLNRNTAIAKIFRTFFYVPVVSSSVATAVIWYWVLNPQKGLLNAALGGFGIQGPAWLYDSHWAMIAIVIMNVWAGFGTNMIIFLGGLQGVPNNLREAARLDGANSFQVFWHVVVPSISPTLFLVTTQLIIGAFQVFDQAYILTKGGPGNATVTIVYYIYDSGFGSLRMGYASALSFVLFAIIFIFSLINMHITNRENS